MKLRRETIVNAPSNEVWNLLGPRYSEAYKWGSSINISKGRGSTGVGKIAGAPCQGRVCDTELGQFQENIEVYNEKKKEIAYTAKGEKMPFFVKRMYNQWKVIPEGGKSRVVMELKVDLMFPFNILMALPMRFQLGGVLRKAHEEFKYFIENDEKPHPRKLAAARAFEKANTQLA